MKYLNKPIAYLQDSDFDVNGNLVNPNIPKNMPVVVMLAANYCHFCTEAKPAYQHFANQTRGKVFCTTIQGDGNMPGEKELAKRLNKINPSFKGYPDYLLFLNGKRVNKDIKGRGVNELFEFVSA